MWCGGEQTYYIHCFFDFFIIHHSPSLPFDIKVMIMRIVSHMMHDGCTRQGIGGSLLLITVIMWHVFCRLIAPSSLQAAACVNAFLHVEITSFLTLTVPPCTMYLESSSLSSIFLPNSDKSFIFANSRYLHFLAPGIHSDSPACYMRESDKSFSSLLLIRNILLAFCFSLFLLFTEYVLQLQHSPVSSAH